MMTMSMPMRMAMRMRMLVNGEGAKRKKNRTGAILRDCKWFIVSSECWPSEAAYPRGVLPQ